MPDMAPQGGKTGRHTATQNPEGGDHINLKIFFPELDIQKLID